MRLLWFLVPACLFAQPDLTGAWVNQKADTGGVTQVTVRRDGSRMLVHVWGACHPIDCDWGEIDAEMWNGIPMAIWKHGFSTVHMQFIPQPDGGMLVAYLNHYNDDSGRKDFGQAEFFVRKDTVAESEETTAARAVLRTTAQTYRTLPAAYIAVRKTSVHKGDKAEARTVTQTTWYLSPPNKERSETTGPRQRELRIADGETEWTIYPDAHVYSRVPQGARGGIGGFRSWYANLDQVRGTPSIAGHETIEGANCTIVRIAMERAATRMLWIDDASHLVRKETLDADNEKDESVYTEARLGEKFDPQLFTYDPEAAQAQNRRQLGREAPATLVGKPAPEFTLRDLDGREVTLSALRGKAVLLDFWGAWCGYCREALPSIEMLSRGLKDKGLMVFGIDSEAPELAREYLQKNGYTFPTLIDRKEEAVNSYHLDGWPTTVLIDREGKVTYYESGYESQKLRDALRALGLW